VTRYQQLLRVIVVGLVALILGALDSLIKGDGAGLIGALSETAAPWFLLAFLAGAATNDRRFLLGALTGLEATVAALIGWYFVNSLIFPFGAYTWTSSFHSSLLTGKVFFELAIASGPVFGAFGAWWKRNLSMVPVFALGLLFILEALSRANVFGPYAHPVAVAEVFVGVLWMSLAFVTTKLLRQRASFQTVH
jgi:Family of unknown function (DUF6518)